MLYQLKKILKMWWYKYYYVIMLQKLIITLSEKIDRYKISEVFYPKTWYYMYLIMHLIKYQTVWNVYIIIFECDEDLTAYKRIIHILLPTLFKHETIYNIGFRSIRYHIFIYFAVLFCRLAAVKKRHSIPADNLCILYIYTYIYI